MALANQERADTSLRWIRQAFVDSGVTANLSTSDVRAAVDATDDWLDAAPAGGATNLAALNAALPVPFRTTATTAQKALVLAFVAQKRGGVA